MREIVGEKRAQRERFTLLAEMWKKPNSFTAKLCYGTLYGKTKQEEQLFMAAYAGRQKLMRNLVKGESNPQAFKPGTSNMFKE